MKLKSPNKHLWWIWSLLSIFLALFLYLVLTQEVESEILMPGPLTDGHHQIAENCEVCHSESFNDKDELQKSCLKCHGDVRIKPLDSHPVSKFKDPRNADRLEKIDALHCVTCHREHKPKLTGENGLTQPKDFCIHCHEDVAEERPSHKDMEFKTCANAGCHNFHNNRALYTDFLIKHLDDKSTLDNPKVPEKEFGLILDQLADYPHERYPVQALKEPDATNEIVNKYPEIVVESLKSKHFKKGVNCNACHLNNDLWINKPGMESCQQCHQTEMDRFTLGKHGMRLNAELDPVQVEQARLPMIDKANHQQVNCNSCHRPHSDDVQEAAVDSCLNCHDDDHSKNYKKSKHFDLWKKELDGTLPKGSGVSCATCHMPRINYDVSDWVSRIMVDHNQSNSLSPNSKMIRPACLHCHGLEFSISSLNSEKLIKNNFIGRSQAHVITMKLAKDEKEKREQSSSEDDDMFVF